ncbi:MAG: DRTGG domain-containing protein [Oscillospiraceae bacterium]
MEGLSCAALAADGYFEVLCLAADAKERQVKGIYCCDLLSVVMSKGFPDAAWVTIMGNINAAAVAALTEMSCIVLADGSSLDDKLLEKAKAQHITVVRSKEPIFETALYINGLLHA